MARESVFLSQGTQNWRWRLGGASTLPKAASRFSSIWLAERTPEDEALIRAMLDGGAHIFIALVRITHRLALTRADARWFDDFLNFVKEQFIQNYWTGVPHKDGPLWEYLLDGSIELESAGDPTYIRTHAAKLSGAGPVV